MLGSSGFFRASRLRSHQSAYRVGHGSGESVWLTRQNSTAFYDLTLKSDSITSAHSVGYKWVRSSPGFKGRGITAPILMSGCQVSQKAYRMRNIIRYTGLGQYNLPQSFKMHFGVCLQQLQHIFLDTDSLGVASLLFLSSLLKGLLQRTNSLGLNITKMACFTTKPVSLPHSTLHFSSKYLALHQVHERDKVNTWVIDLHFRAKLRQPLVPQGPQALLGIG